MRQTHRECYCLARFVDSYDDKGKIKEGERRSSVISTQGNSMLNDMLPVTGSRRNKVAVEVRDLEKADVNSIKGSSPSRVILDQNYVRLSDAALNVLFFQKFVLSKAV